MAEEIKEAVEEEKKTEIEEEKLVEKKEEKPEAKLGALKDEVAKEKPIEEKKKAVKKTAVKKAAAMPRKKAVVTEPLVSIEDYLKAGIHIGSQYKSGDMKPYIYKTRQDGLHVLDVQTIDKRIKFAAALLSKYEPAKILVVAGRVYARAPARKFAENVGTLLSVKRFVPGTLTNPLNPNFVEPKLVMVSDPGVDKQAVSEAKKVNLPVIALCDTNNMLKNVDLAVPVNNKGKKSVALVYWLLTREVMLARGLIKSKAEFKQTSEDFEMMETETK